MTSVRRCMAAVCRSPVALSSARAVPDAAAAIAADWPQPADPRTNGRLPPTPTAVVGHARVAAADIGWRDFFVDPSLEELIARALDNNRDLRVAVLNVERARALYRIQRADRLPSLGANAALTAPAATRRSHRDATAPNLGIAAFELDLFGRVRNLSDAALQQLLRAGRGAAQRAARLIAEVANVYLTLAADQELQRLAQATLQTRSEAYSADRAAPRARRRVRARRAARRAPRSRARAPTRRASRARSRRTSTR